MSEGIKLNIVIVQNHGFASIGALSESLGSQRFGTNYRYRDPATGMLDGDKLPVDLAANAGVLGAEVIRVTDDRGVPRSDRHGPGVRPHHRHPHRDRPARPRALLGELVGRAGERGRRTRLHPPGPQDLRGPQARPAAPDLGGTQTVRTVSHWIGGKPATGHVHPHEPGLEPGHRRAAGRGAAGHRRRRRRPPCRPRRPPSSPGRSRRCRSARRCCSPSASWSTRAPSELAEIISDEHGKVALRRPRRGAARPGGHRVRLRHPLAAQGRLLRPGLHAASTCSPSASRSGSAPGSRRSTSRPWCRCGCTRWPSPPATPSCSSPVERDPSRLACYVAELWAEAGLPDGVFNVVHGDKESVDALLDHPDVAAVSFVGSTPIAKYIHETRPAHGKRVQALGGAKNHAIVLPDAGIDYASDHLVAAAFGSAGERCMAISAAVAVGRRGRRARRRRVGEGPRDQGRPRPRRRQPRWARSSPPPPATGSSG